MTRITDKTYALNDLQGRVHMVAREPLSSKTELSNSLNDLAKYFAEKRDFRLKDGNRHKRNFWEPTEVNHGDFLIDIVNSMMIAEIGEDEFSSCGRGLIDLMGKIYVNCDDSSYFGGFVLPKFLPRFN